MSNKDIILVMPGNATTGSMPFVSRPENLDAWPSEAATQTALDTIAEIIKRGYAGVQVDMYSMAGGHAVVNFSFNEETPEGRMSQVLLGFAYHGKFQPLETSLAILERIYREQDLPIPTNKKSGA